MSPPEDLNLGPYTPHFTSTYIYGVIIPLRSMWYFFFIIFFSFLCLSIPAILIAFTYIRNFPFQA